MDWSDWGPNEIPDRVGACPEPYLADVCPGWAVRQTTVAEASVAYEASKSGELALFFPGNENTVLEAVQVLRRAFNLFEVERLKKPPQSHSP